MNTSPTNAQTVETPSAAANSRVTSGGSVELVCGIHYATGEPLSIDLHDGKIRQIEALPSARAGDLPTIAPGFVDLQVNGYLGRDFNTLPIAQEMVGELIRLLWREGVTSCYPTVITNSEPAILDAMSAIARACDADAAADRGIAGIHLEGPFISPQDGARGAHAREFVQAPNWDMFRRWQEASGGRIRIVTMSPEWPRSTDFISHCAAMGVTVSIGHTSATPEQIRDAVSAGARMSTHLGNGTHLSLPRHPNYMWEQLAQDDLWTCLIGDGFHLPDQVLKVVMRVKGEHALLVSDATSLAGMPPGTYDTHVGGKVVLTPAGRTHLLDNDKILAGSAQMLLHSVEHLTSRKLADLARAWDMASICPATFMGLPVAAGLTVGAPADFVLLRKEGDKIRLENTFKAGVRVYST